MKRVFLLTGSNLGDSNSFLRKAKTVIGYESGKIVRESGIYSSESWGYQSKGHFLNQCIELETELGPYELLEKILVIEARLGRIRAGMGYSDRKIDIDILFYDNEIIEDESLVIPHPRMHLRMFALVPMNEIAPDFLHPVLGNSIKELIGKCPDKSPVKLNHIP